MSSYVASQAAANTTTGIASSSFLEKNGNVLGFILSFTYIIIASYVIYLMLKDKDKKMDKYIFILPLLFILLAIVDFIYYYFSKDSVDQARLNSYVGNISLIPVYLLIIAFFIMIIAGSRGI